MELGLQEKYFNAVKNGKKTVEGRLFKNKFEELKNGDTIVFYKDLENGTRTDESIKVKVSGKEMFNNVDSMLKKMTLKSVLPGVKSYKEGKEVYEKIYGEELGKGKMIGISFELLKNSANLKKNKNMVKTKEEELVKKKDMIKPKNMVKTKDENMVKTKEENMVKTKEENMVKNKDEGTKNKEKKYENRNKLIEEITEKSNKPQIYEMHIREPWLTLIKTGLKEVEGRLFSGPVEQYKIGDKINFIHKDKEGKEENVVVEITKLTKYPDFKSLLFHEKFFRVLPGFPDLKTANYLFEKIYNFKLIKDHGALGINFKLV